MKRVVVFGATGSIGLYLVDYLRDKLPSDLYEVIAVARRCADFFHSKGIAFYNVDISKSEQFAVLPDTDVYAVINCAGVLPAYTKSFDPHAYIESNVTGSINILEYARACNADRVLYLQTWAEQAGHWNTREVLSPDLPRMLCYKGDHAFYSITKSMVADTMEFYWQEYGIKKFIFRLPNVYMYAPRKTYYVDGVEKKIGYRYMIERATKGLDIELWGNPNAFKDILYVKDLCQMMCGAVLTSVEGGVYNAGTGTKTTLREQIEGIVEIFSPEDKKSQIIEVPKESTFVSFVMSIENAVIDLGYQPRYGYIDYLKDYKLERDAKRFDGLYVL